MIAFVNDKAISAGAMIALACDEIVMSPGATSATPPRFPFRPPAGIAALGAAERAKAESPCSPTSTKAPAERLRPAAGRAMVAVKPVVYWVESDAAGERRFVDAEEYQRDGPRRTTAGSPCRRAKTPSTAPTRC